jgi:hypothetical protein
MTLLGPGAGVVCCFSLSHAGKAPAGYYAAGAACFWSWVELSL